MKVVIIEDAPDGLWVSDDVLPTDETIEIPESVWLDYRRRVDDLVRVENQIRQFAREQERQRSYQD